MTKKHKHSKKDSKKATLPCSFKCTGRKAVLTCSKNECSYAIADEQGRIILKGTFSDSFELDLSTLNDGFYTAVLFNGDEKKSFPFKIE